MYIVILKLLNPVLLDLRFFFYSKCICIFSLHSVNHFNGGGYCHWQFTVFKYSNFSQVFSSPFGLSTDMI